MQKLAQKIVQARKWILAMAILLLIPSAIGYINTKVNYDILTYLPESYSSRVGETILDEEFNLASTAMITIENMPSKQIEDLKAKLSSIDGVEKVMWTSDLVDTTIPHTVLPTEVQDFFYNKEGATMMIVSFVDGSGSPRTTDAIKEIKATLNEQCFIGGLSAITEDTQELFNSEMFLYVLVAVVLVAMVLFLGLESWLAPIVFIISIIFPIVYNFGTNYFLGQISYITKALAAVLQLGVTMDFSIFLLHRYEEEKINCASRKDAMANAIANTFTSISGSSLTTIAGFLAMCTMTLTLGMDIGIVMAKGVFLGVICTVTILPALIMAFDPWLEKYKHRTFIPRFNKLADYIVRHYKMLLVVGVCLFIPFLQAQNKTQVYYTLFDSLPENLPSIVGTNRLKEDFDMTTTHFVLIDRNMAYQDKNKLLKELEDVDGLNQVLSYESFVGGMIPESILPEEIKEIFYSGDYELMLCNSSYKSGSDLQNQQLDKMQEILNRYDPDGYITGEGAMTKDLIETADIDFQNVNLTSITAVFIIILIVFKSISVPVILVAAIELAITINMGIPYFEGDIIPFITSIVIGTIQLGATVDYAILMTSRFREERNNGLSPKEACRVAIKNCSTSILTSGLAFFGATIGVSFVSKIELIENLCSMISRGAIISMITILFLLPALLIVFDKVIEKTSYKWLDKGGVPNEN